MTVSESLDRRQLEKMLRQRYPKHTIETYKEVRGRYFCRLHAV